MGKMKDEAINKSNNKDIHSECSHCTITKPPVWPVTSMEEWLIDLCHSEAFSEAVERQAKQHQKDLVKSAEITEKRKKDLEQKRRDRVAIRMRTMREAKERRLGLLQLNYGGITNMAKKNTTSTAEVAAKAPTKTGLLDSLIGADLEGSYAEGAKETIVAQVIAQFPDLEAKRVSGLFFSRRAVLKAQAAKLEATAA
jgi:hypothetical protein